MSAILRFHVTLSGTNVSNSENLQKLLLFVCRVSDFGVTPKSEIFGNVTTSIDDPSFRGPHPAPALNFPGVSFFRFWVSKILFDPRMSRADGHSRPPLI